MKAAPVFGLDDVMLWQRLEPPYWWDAIGAHVIGDRHLPDGTRQHMVEGHVEHGLVVGNAQIFGRADLEQDQPIEWAA